MANISSSRFPYSTEEGIIHTGMFVKPRFATALQEIILNKKLETSNQFSIAKSQVYPSGLCELIVKKLNPAISSSTILNQVKSCCELVQGHFPSTASTAADLDSTIDLTESDNSMCVDSPIRPNTRKVFLKVNTNSIGSNVRRNSPASPLCSTPRPLVVTCSNYEGSSSTNYSRKVSIQPGSADSLKVSVTSVNSTCLQSVNERVQSGQGHASVVPNNHSHESLSSTSKNDADDVASSWVKSGRSHYCFSWPKPLIFSQENDKAESASGGAKVDEPQNNVNESNLDQMNVTKTKEKRHFIDGNNLEFQNSSKNTDDPKSTGNLNVSDASSFKMSSSSTNQGNTMCGDSDSSGSIPEIGNKRRNIEKLQPEQVDSSLKADVKAKETSSKVSDDVEERSCKENEKIIHSEKVEICSTSDESSKSLVRQLANPTEKEGTQDVCIIGNDSVQCIDSDDEDDDDDIIVEKELQKPLLIVDSDDDIKVCAIVNAQKPNKRKQNQKKNKTKICAGTTFVASTSVDAAPDFIPLNPTYRRVDPKNLKARQIYEAKLSKREKLKAKKERKAAALQNQALHSGGQSNAKESARSGKGPKETNHWKSVQDNSSAKGGSEANKVNRLAASGSQAPSQGESFPSKSKNEQKYEYCNNIINLNSEMSRTGLRPIVIDASNVAIGYGLGRFSVKGLIICVKYFTDRGHKVYACAPQFRRASVPLEDQKLLDTLKSNGVLIYTPSRTMQDGRKVASYDDRFIVQIAAELGGIIVSRDNYRDLLAENESWRETIEQRLLMFTWVGDMLLFPNDPLGRNGPHLQEFLRFPDPSPK